MRWRVITYGQGQLENLEENNTCAILEDSELQIKAEDWVSKVWFEQLWDLNAEFNQLRYDDEYIIIVQGIKDNEQKECG